MSGNQEDKRCVSCGRKSYSTGILCTDCRESQLNSDALYYDESSDHGDEFDRYEDYYEETGQDPYGLFEELADVRRVDRLLNAITRAKRKIAALIRKMRNLGNAYHTDDIPF